MNKYLKLASIWLVLGSALWGIGGLKFYFDDQCVIYKPQDSSQGSYLFKLPSIGACEKSKKILVWYPNSSLDKQLRHTWPNDTNTFLGIFLVPSLILAFVGWRAQKEPKQIINNVASAKPLEHKDQVSQQQAHNKPNAPWNWWGLPAVLIIFLANGAGVASSSADARSAAIAQVYVLPAVGFIACVLAIVIGVRRHLRGNWLPIVGIIVLAVRFIFIMLAFSALNHIR